LYDIIEKDKNYLYVDVGGGSTEFTFFSMGKLVASKSFKMGTVRFLDEKQDISKTWNDAKKWVKEKTKDYPNCMIIGSGGNINKVFKLSAAKIGKPLSKRYLAKEYNKIKKLTYIERVRDLGLNPDRADVIIPALEIYISALKWNKSDKMLVPKIGLADGIIKKLYSEK
jgi:exopolyphosphatase/guanosine-5'-triphosphate,3'-diphosphate pyrophosphatase